MRRPCAVAGETEGAEEPLAEHGWQCSSLALFVCVRWREEHRATFLPKHTLCYLVFILVTV